MSPRKIPEIIPVAPMKLIALESMQALGEKVNQRIVETRHQAYAENPNSPAHLGYQQDTYLIDYSIPRFGTGEAKAVINETIVGKDLFILADVMNYSNTYKMWGDETMKSPDDQFQDLKRVIAAAKISKPKRINIIMPFLYESRQHRRDKLESLDCADALEELYNMGIDNFITFDAHDPTVQNAIPIRGFDNFYTSYQFIKELLIAEPQIKVDKQHMMIISPDEGGMTRAVYYANVLGLEMGMFYKRRDYSTIIDGRNPIVSHEFLGSSVEGKDVFIIDDIISSGDSMLEVAAELKKRKAAHVYIAATFGLFCNGIERFDRAFEEKVFDRIFTTNLVYTPEEIFTRPYYSNVDLTRYIALIMDTLNHDTSINNIISQPEMIKDLLAVHNSRI